jgi:hypothetical protein
MSKEGLFWLSVFSLGTEKHYSATIRLVFDSLDQLYGKAEVMPP